MPSERPHPFDVCDSSVTLNGWTVSIVLVSTPSHRGLLALWPPPVLSLSPRVLVGTWPGAQFGRKEAKVAKAREKAMLTNQEQRHLRKSGGGGGGAQGKNAW